MWQRRMRWLNNPAQPNVNNVANQFRFRLYWDEPLRYGVGSNPPPFTAAAGAPTPRFGYADIGFGSKEHKDLTYAQVVSSTTLFSDRVSILTGIRSDSLKRTIRQMIGNDPVTGYTIYGGFDPALKANRAGYLMFPKPASPPPTSVSSATSSLARPAGQLLRELRPAHHWPQQIQRRHL